MAVVPHPTKSKKEPGRWWYIDIGRGKTRQRIPFRGTYDEAVQMYRELATAESGRQETVLLPKIRDMVLPFLEWYQHECAAKTYDDFRLNIGKHIIPSLGNYRPDQLSQKILDDFRADMIASGSSPRTINKTLSYLSTMVRWGVGAGTCKNIPARLPRFSRRKTESKPRQSLSAAQIDALYTAIDQEYKLLFLLMADHGLRKDEAMSLSRNDIDLDHKMIMVLGKGNKYRFVPFMSDRFEHELKLAMEQGRGEGPLVINPTTGLPYTGMRKALLRAAQQVGVTTIGHHILRHSFATRMAEKGMSPYALQRLMGHTSQETTDKIYVHIGGDHVASEARKLRDR